MKTPIVVNLIGGPGSGKSTIAAGLFYELKKLGYKAELVTEYAKDKVYEKSFKTLSDQFYVFGHQFHKIWTLIGEADIIITDSPFILSIYYSKMDSEYFEPFVVEQYKKFNNITCFVNRETKYQTNGRMQTEEEAIAIDLQVKQMLERNNIPYMTSSTTSATKDILDIIKSK